jgi:hypothetical protein
MDLKEIAQRYRKQSEKFPSPLEPAAHTCPGLESAGTPRPVDRRCTAASLVIGLWMLANQNSLHLACLHSPFIAHDKAGSKALIENLSQTRLVDPR